MDHFISVVALYVVLQFLDQLGVDVLVLHLLVHLVFLGVLNPLQSHQLILELLDKQVIFGGWDVALIALILVLRLHVLDHLVDMVEVKLRLIRILLLKIFLVDVAITLHVLQHLHGVLVLVDEQTQLLYQKVVVLIEYVVGLEAVLLGLSLQQFFLVLELSLVDIEYVL